MTPNEIIAVLILFDHILNLSRNMYYLGRISVKDAKFELYLCKDEFESETVNEFVFELFMNDSS